MDSYARDLAQLIDTLDLRDVILAGHCTGGGDVTRYVGRHGTSRVVKVVLLDAIPPLMLKTPDNPDGSPIETVDEIRAGVARDRSQFYKDLSGPFYGANRPGADVSQGVRDAFRLWSVRYHPPFSRQYGVARSDTRGCPENARRPRESWAACRSASASVRTRHCAPTRPPEGAVRGSRTSDTCSTHCCDQRSRHIQIEPPAARLTGRGTPPGHAVRGEAGGDMAGAAEGDQRVIARW